MIDTISLVKDTISEADIIPCEQHSRTTPFQYAQGLRKILKANPSLSKEELARRIDRSVAWVEEHLHIIKEDMRIYWDNRHALTSMYELRAHPAAMLLKLRKMSGGTWFANCLGEATDFPGSLTDIQAKNAAIGWMLPILDNLRDSLAKLHSG